MVCWTENIEFKARGYNFGDGSLGEEMHGHQS